MAYNRSKGRRHVVSGNDIFEGGEEVPPPSQNFQPCGVCGRTFLPESLPQDQSWKKNNWRAKHDDFVNSIRAARGVSIAMKSGQPLPPPPPASLNPDYVQCDHCLRRFNKKAAERHIPFCKEKHDRLPANNTKTLDPTTRARVEARKYRVPLPKGKSGSTRTPQQPQRFTSSASTAGGGGNAATSRSNMQSRSAGQGVAQRRPGQAAGIRRDGGGGDYESFAPFTDGLTGSAEPSYADSLMTVSSPAVRQTGSGRALRTGRDPHHYAEARKHLAASSNSDSAFAVRKANPAQRRAAPPGRFNRNLPSSSDPFQSEERTPTPPSYPRASAPKGILKNSSSSATNSHDSGYGHSPASSPQSNFCYDCGTRYPTVNAKFCFNCGVKRIEL